MTYSPRSRLVQSASARQIPTAHLAQTMALIAMPAAELEAALAAELAANPALELVEGFHCPKCGRRLKHPPCQVCEIKPRSAEEPVVYLSTYNSNRGLHQRADETERRDQIEICEPESLAEHVLKQIAPALDPQDRFIAVYLLARLDERGFLGESPAESAQFLRVSLQRIEAVLHLIQRADPPGVGARDVRECLLLQLDVLEGDDPIRALARDCLLKHWDALSHHDLARIARAEQVTVEQAQKAVDYLHRNLAPYPAQLHWGDGRTPPPPDPSTYFRPDVIISRLPHSDDGALQVEVFTPIAGQLRADVSFKAALADCAEEERERCLRYLERAQLFAKCLQQRNNTMVRLLEAIASHQRNFILNGDGHLKPLTRAAVAARLGVHESTISRAVAGKTVALPDGRIVPLAKFFDRSLSARHALKHIVADERRPLTDDEIAARLARQGFKVARRTVAKYRAAEGILPAAARRRKNSRADGARP